MLPKRIPKPGKRASRWRSRAHCDFVRSFACAMCGSTVNNEVAHVRMGSGAGMGQKPDDFRTVPLCGTRFVGCDAELGCHPLQHNIGEESFWKRYEEKHGQTVDRLLSELCAASPRRREIEQEMKDRG